MSSENIRGQIKTTGTQLVLNNDGNSTTVQAGSPAANIVLTLPAAPSGNAATLVDTNSTQTLSGKTFTAPVLGAATATSINKVSLTAPATGATLTIAEGKTLTSNASITLAGTDGSQLSLAANLTTSGANAVTLTTTGATSVTLPTSGTLATTSDKLSAFAATTSAELAGVISDETGTGSLVLASSPALITPTVATSLDVPSAQAFALLASAGANNITIGGPTSTVVVAGNLEVQGTTTTLNTATLDVEDVNITINKGGTNGSANGAGLTVEKGWDASTNGTLVWDTTAKKFKMGQAGSEIELVDLSSTQVLTGKTYSGLTISATTGTLTMTNSKTLSVTHTATIAGADDTGVLTLAAGAQVVGGNSNNNDIITRTATQTLTNKTLTSPSLTTPSVDVMTLDGQASAPANPSSGFYKTYVADSDGKLHILDSSGNDVAVGSGSSGRNYLGDWFDSAKAESVGTSAATSTGNRTVAGNTDPTKWVTSDLTNLTFSRSADTTLRQSYNYLINSGDANADFVESPLFTLDGVDLGKPITVSFDCAGVSASDDYQVCAVRYDSSGTYQEVIVIAGTASATTPYSARIPTGTTKFQGFFVAGSTATDQYAIRFMKHAVNVDLRIDSLYVGPEKVVQGAGISDPVVYTPTYSTNAPSVSASSKTIYARTGKYLDLYLNLVFTGAGSDGNPFTASFPSTVSIDTNYIATTALSIGFPCEWYDASVASGAKTKAIMARIDATNNKLSFFETTDAGTGAQINNNTIASGDSIEVALRVPITGWSSNVTMADRAVEEYASNSSVTNTTDTTSFAYGMAGSPVPSSNPAAVITKRVRFNTPRQPGDILITEVAPNGNDWVVFNGIVIGTGAVGMCPFAYAEHDSSATGLGAPVWVNSTDVDVSIGTRGYYSNGAARENWVSLNSAGFMWRVRKVSGGGVAGYPIGARNIVGDTTGTTVPSGYIGQIVTSSVTTAQNVGTSAQYFDMTSITLTPGTWLITGNAIYIRNSATLSGVELDIGFSAVSGNSSTGLAPCVNHSYELGHSTSFTYTQINLPTIVLRYDGTTATMQNGGTLTPTNGVFYLKGYVGTYSAATPQYTCGVTALRIA